MFQAENGVLGIGESPEKGEEDAHLCNAAGYPVRAVKGASYFDTTMSFAMIRKGKIDITILGSLQVSQSGDLANWLVPGKRSSWYGRGDGACPKSEKSGCRHESYRSKGKA
nr:CoA-transferase [Bacillus subtilis]